MVDEETKQLAAQDDLIGAMNLRAGGQKAAVLNIDLVNPMLTTDLPTSLPRGHCSMKLAVNNSDLTIRDWLKSRSHRPLTEDEETTLKLILKFDHEAKELVRYGKLK